MEKCKARSDNFIEGHKCEKCDKVYKRKSYLSRHRLAKHDHDKVQQLKLENEYLLLEASKLGRMRAQPKDVHSQCQHMR